MTVYRGIPLTFDIPAYTVPHLDLQTSVPASTVPHLYLWLRIPDYTVLYLDLWLRIPADTVPAPYILAGSLSHMSDSLSHKFSQIMKEFKES